MRVNSNAKGAAFEREQAKLISLWLSNGEDKDMLWRTGLSGGRASQGQVKGAHIGDLGIIKGTIEVVQFVQLFCVECKRYQSLDLLKGWLNLKSDLRSFWSQVSREATANNLRPLLIVKPDRCDTLIMFDTLVANLVPSFKDLESFRLTGKGMDITGYRQEEVFSSVGWSEVNEALSGLSRRAK